MLASKVITPLKTDSPNVTFIPPNMFYLCLAMGIVFELFASQPVFSNYLYIRILAGATIAFAGFAFMGKAHYHFKKKGTSESTFKPASTFVSDGPYKICRNPMYTGGSVFFLGIGLAAGSLWLLLAYIPLFVYLNFYVIPKEEAYLERRFGNDYTKFRKKVRRWI